MKRDEMILVRDLIIRGDPPYTIDAVGSLRRDKGGTLGLDELMRLGDFSPTAAGVRLALETQLKIIDHLLERMR